MQKIKTSIMTAGCLFFIQFAHAAKVEIEGEVIDCDVKSFSHLLCANKGKRILVVLGDDSAIAIEQDNNGMTKLKTVQKISEGKKTLFNSSVTYQKAVDTKAKRASDANIVAGLSNASMPELSDFVNRAKGYLRSDGIIENAVKVNYNNKTFECNVGYSTNPIVQVGNKRRFDKNLKCPFYGCKGKDGESAIVHIPLHDDGNGNTNLVIMKNGTAQYIDSGFTVDDGSDVLVETGLVSKPLALESRLPMKSDYFIPTGYQGDKKTFLYMTNLNQDDYLIHAQKMCAEEPNLKKLFKEQKQISDKLTEISEQKKLVELVTTVNDRLRYIYVDREKGLRAGCMHNEKIYANSKDNKEAVIFEAYYAPEEEKEYIDEDDVQAIYKQVKYIPAGGSGMEAGAEARAHMISRKIKDLGVVHQKIWIKGNLNQSWNYNVAVSVLVKKKNGEFERYVIDNGLITPGPLTEAAWIKNMVKNNKDPVITTTYPIAENVATFHRTVVAHSNSDMYGMEVEVLTEKEKTDRAYKEFGEENQQSAAGQIE